jgi:hypothetical protein
MTCTPDSTKSRRPRSLEARTRRLAEIFAECSAGIVPGDYSEAAISAFAADLATELRQFPPRTPKPRQPRVPRFTTLIEQAKKIGGSITLADGTKLDFGKPESAAPENPWFDDLKVTKQ